MDERWKGLSRSFQKPVLHLLRNGWAPVFPGRVLDGEADRGQDGKKPHSSHRGGCDPRPRRGAKPGRDSSPALAEIRSGEIVYGFEALGQPKSNGGNQRGPSDAQAVLASTRRLFPG